MFLRPFVILLIIAGSGEARHAYVSALSRYDGELR